MGDLKQALDAERWGTARRRVAINTEQQSRCQPFFTDDPTALHKRRFRCVAGVWSGSLAPV